jgi:hypothetical protein
MEPSVHDNRILSYTVLAETREIRISTVYDEVDLPEQAEILFTGVLAYHFEGDTLSTIIFDVEERPFAEVYRE